MFPGFDGDQFQEGRKEFQLAFFKHVHRDRSLAGIPLSFEGISAVNTSLGIFYGVAEQLTFPIRCQCHAPQISSVRSQFWLFHPSNDHRL